MDNQIKITERKMALQLKLFLKENTLDTRKDVLSICIDYNNTTLEEVNLYTSYKKQGGDILYRIPMNVVEHIKYDYSIPTIVDILEKNVEHFADINLTYVFYYHKWRDYLLENIPAEKINIQYVKKWDTYNPMGNVLELNFLIHLNKEQNNGIQKIVIYGLNINGIFINPTIGIYSGNTVMTIKALDVVNYLSLTIDQHMLDIVKEIKEKIRNY